MEKALFLLIHYGIALAALGQLFWARPKSRLGHLSRAAIWGSLLLFVFLWGQFPMVGGYNLRYVPMIVLIVLLGVTTARFRQSSTFSRPGIWSLIWSALGFIIAAPFIYMAILLIVGRSYPGEMAKLTFPLKNGTYYIASGGSNRVINNHIRQQPNSQQFALDINKLGYGKRISRGILSVKNTDHFIFGERVYAPCSGKVIAVKNNVPDNTEASMDVGPEDGTGNYVELQCGDLFIFMPHLKEGSVKVLAGMEVDTTTVLGQVGNSGYSQEPHLHFQASRKDSLDRFYGVPMQLDNKKLYRNSLFRKQL